MTRILLLCLLIGAPVSAQDTISYHIAFPNAAHHEARVTLEARNLPAGPLELRMSRSSPGRYALHEFAKNVYSVTARDGAGRTLTPEIASPHSWRIAGHDGAVRIEYTLFGDHADGTYAGIDATHAHLNMPATFAWLAGTEARPIRVTFAPPAGSNWRVATQLVPTTDAFSFTAPDFQYFMDSPTEVSDFALRTWTVNRGGEEQTIRIAMHHVGTEAELETYTRHARAIAEEQAAIYGTYPDFDYGTYTFLADYLPWVFGDGMEHRNSTILTSRASLASNMNGLLNTLSHEFFHAWNMERIRSDALEPFDFTEANMSLELWFGEGFTSYYDDLVMRRAGVLDDTQYLQGLSFVLNAVINGRGRDYFSPMGMSAQAPFVDAAVSVDETNRANTFISYYTWGAALGLALDLTLRSRFDGVTLDDFMRAVWDRHGKTFDNYDVADLEQTLAAVSGDAAFAKDYFDRFIRGSAVPDYESLLAHGGAVLRRANPGAASLGPAAWDSVDGGVLMTSRALVRTPLYLANVEEDDVIHALGNTSVATPAELTAAIAALRPGQETTITYTQRGRRLTVPITAVEDERLVVVPFEAEGREITDAIRRFRAAWLGPRA